jgi:hypothetical protein
MPGAGARQHPPEYAVPRTMQRLVRDSRAPPRQSVGSQVQPALGQASGELRHTVFPVVQSPDVGRGDW